jgi:hypothetical protein
VTDTDTPQESTSKKPMALLLVGILCSLIACVIAQTTDLAPKLQLDIRGGHAQGTAEEASEGAYLLRYEHPGGTIYRRQYKGKLGGEADEDGRREIQIVYNKKEPEVFQPRGLSFVPTLCAGVLFFMGLACVFRARRGMRRPIRRVLPKS